MLSLVIIFTLAFLAFISSVQRDSESSVMSLKVSERMSSLWDTAHSSMKENKLVRAEKALLTILNIDKKNAAAYNRLGILYAKQKEYKDAIDCFEIASSIDPSASSLHNLGLIYYETENWEKASTAFEHAIKLEDTLAARHIAFAKVQEKVGNHLQVIKSLERAVELESTKESLNLLHQAYLNAGREDDAAMVARRMGRVKQTGSKARVRRHKRIVA